MAVRWTRYDDFSLCGVASAEDGRIYQLLVERLPENGWDWTVWVHGVPGQARSGCASSPELAQRWAEAVLGDMMAGVNERT